MSWRTVVIQNGGKISLKNNQLLIQQQQKKITVPLEDIAVILIENRETIITTPLLSALAKQGITLITCDEQHLPCGQWLPFNQFFRPLKILKLQLNISLPLKKKLWSRIVKQKILNQAFVLQQLNYLKEVSQLESLTRRIKSGDKENIEAQAAIIYFKCVFGNTFSRHQENPINAHLNYAYSIFRSAIARTLVLHGWQPTLGLCHHNEYNPFNLADDFIEPFRPLVDLKVWDLWKNNKIDKGLTSKTKQQLVSLLNYQVYFQTQSFNVLAAIERTISSLQQTLIMKNPDLLKLPEIRLLKEHPYE